MKSLAVALMAFSLAVLPSLAWAQPARPGPGPGVAQPGQGQMVVVMPFTGEATEGLLRDAETAVRNGLLARGAQVPDRVTIEQAGGVNPQTDPAGVVAFARNMGATHAITGTVLPLAGQYTLALTAYEVSTGHSGRQERNVGDEGAGPTIVVMLDALFAPGALRETVVTPPASPPSTSPPDPDAARRAEEARQREETARRAAASQQQADALRNRTAWEAAHPVRRFSAGGPIAVGASLGLGTLIAGGRSSPTGTVSGGAPPAPSRLAVSLRFEGAYALDAVPGLELVAGVLYLGSPTAALGLGVGAQYNLPASGRGAFRATGGVLLGLFQGLSGAQITSAWIAPYVRAEYQLLPQLAAFGGVGMDIVPGSNGGLTAFSVLLGARFRFGGGDVPTGASTAVTSSGPTQGGPGTGSDAGFGTPSS